MTDKKRAQVKAINEQIRALRKALQEALEAGAVSASMSTAGNAQSYTRFSPSEYRKQIADLQKSKFAIIAGMNAGRRRTSPDFG